MTEITSAERKRNLVPDIASSVKLLKCNLKSTHDLSTLFPYSRFQQYLNSLNEIQRIKRLQAIIRGENVPPLEFYNDEYFKREISNIYGPLDEDSLHFQKLFNNYKEERLEEIGEWRQNEHKLKAQYKNNPDSLLSSITTTITQDFEEIPDLKNEFTIEELELFESVKNCPNSGYEWFNLPRKILNTEEIKNLKRNSLNLAVFDPELHQYSGGARIIPPLEERGISEKLSLNIYEILCDHPEGIVYSEFLAVYRKKFNYNPDLYGLGYKTPYSFLADLNHIVVTRTNGPRNELVLFPTFLENFITTPTEIFWRIYHKLVIFLHFFDGVAKTDDLIHYFENLYHLKLPLKSWGFRDADDFVCFLVAHEKWRNQDYAIEKASFISDSNKDGHYVIHMTKARKKAIQEKKNSLHVKSISDCRVVPQISAISKLYAQQGDWISSYSECIFENKEDVFVVAWLVSPYELEIVKKSTWDCDYGSKWTKLYKDLLKTPGKRKEISINTQNLGKDFLLVIYDKERDEFMRAKYVKVAEKFHQFTVELIDEGGRMDVHQDNMYYLRKAWMNEYKAQVIRARVVNIQLPPNSKGTKEYNAVFDQVQKLTAHGNGIRVRFLSSNGGVWLVQVKIGPNKQDPDLGHVLSNYCKKFGLPNCTKKGGIGSQTPKGRIMDTVVDKTDSDFESSGYGDGQSTNTATNGSGQASGLEWRADNAAEPPVAQKKPSYQPKSYADTAASSTWRSQPNHDRNFATESSAFPTLAESQASISAKPANQVKRQNPGAQTQQFSYANAASHRK